MKRTFGLDLCNRYSENITTNIISQCEFFSKYYHSRNPTATQTNVPKNYPLPFPCFFYFWFLDHICRKYVGLPGWRISPPQSLYWTGQIQKYSKTLSVIRIYQPSAEVSNGREHLRQVGHGNRPAYVEKVKTIMNKWALRGGPTHMITVETSELYKKIIKLI